MLSCTAIANDNASNRVYVREGDCFQHIPAARYLIEQFVTARWKHDLDDPDYIDMEILLCRYMLQKR